MAKACSPRRERVFFERLGGEDGAGLGRDAFGLIVAEVPEWTELGSRLAVVWWGGSAERRNRALDQDAIVSATFRVLNDRLTGTLSARDRLRYAGEVWDIQGIVPVGTGARELELTATAAKG